MKSILTLFCLLLSSHQSSAQMLHTPQRCYELKVVMDERVFTDYLKVDQMGHDRATFIVPGAFTTTAPIDIIRRPRDYVETISANFIGKERGQNIPFLLQATISILKKSIQGTLLFMETEEPIPFHGKELINESSDRCDQMSSLNP